MIECSITVILFCNYSVHRVLSSVLTFLFLDFFSTKSTFLLLGIVMVTIVLITISIGLIIKRSKVNQASKPIRRGKNDEDGSSGEKVEMEEK